jgi:hypothetical protein
VVNRLLISTSRNVDLIYRDEFTIKYDKGDTIFVNEAKSKPKSSEHDYGRTSSIPQHRRFRISALRHVPPSELVAMTLWLQQ